MKGSWKLFLRTAVLISTAFTVGMPVFAAGPEEWSLLSRDQINPPGVRSFVETSFTRNRLKVGPEGNLWLGFTAIPKERRDTDVFFSRHVRAQGQWTEPVPIARTKDLERSPELWIDPGSGVVHFAWVANEKRPGGARSELRLGYQRSKDGGSTWSIPRVFPVGTALARRPQLAGDGQGNLYLVICNGYPGKGERIQLFQSADGGGNWRPVDVNFPEEERRGWIGWPQLAVGSNGQASLIWLDQTLGSRAVVFSRTTGEFTWSPPIRINDDRAQNCTEPRLAIRGDSVYVVWRVGVGDRTSLYFDHSSDGGATWDADLLVFDAPERSVQASLQPVDGGVLAGWFGIRRQKGRSDRRLSYRLYRTGKGWAVPAEGSDSLAGEHRAGSFFNGFDLLPWRQGCLVAYSKGIVGVSYEIFLGWSEDLKSGFSELMRISAPKKGFEHLYPRLVRSGENEVAVVYNRRKIRRSPMEPRVTLGDVLVARIGEPSLEPGSE